MNSKDLWIYFLILKYYFEWVGDRLSFDCRGKVKNWALLVAKAKMTRICAHPLRFVAKIRIFSLLILFPVVPSRKLLHIFDSLADSSNSNSFLYIYTHLYRSYTCVYIYSIFYHQISHGTTSHSPGSLATFL